jgi:amino acid transporter
MLFINANSRQYFFQTWLLQNIYDNILHQIMMNAENPGFFGRLKEIFIGKAKNPLDRATLHNISLVAFFAWVGLGSDGMSSACYGPAEAFGSLGQHYYLGILVAVATALTIFVIAESYMQIIELFPNGGGGYFVATELLSPTVGMISGAALLVDYVLTITISIASGADALFSMLPAPFIGYKIGFAVIILIVMILLNLRGVKESVIVLMPIFLAFVITHVGIIFYALYSHALGFSGVAHATVSDIQSSVSQVGYFGLLIVLLKAYSMGAGTYTGIEAVSNGLPILREPRVKTAKTTMTYMMISLAVTVFGLMLAFTLYRVQPVTGQTLNAVLFDKVLGGFGIWGYGLVILTLLSEAAILFVAAQTGFIDGPRILSNMAADRWVPKRFALLSDRLVTMNGIFIMGVSSIILMVFTGGSVGYLVVLYAINVFITFCLSQLGMVKHWWLARKENPVWLKKLLLNGFGLVLTSFILISMTIMKFQEGGWITLFITGTLILIMLGIRGSYMQTRRLCRQMDVLVSHVEASPHLLGLPNACDGSVCQFDPKSRTAVIFVKDYTGIGLKTLHLLFKSFGNSFKNFVFVQLGLIDAGTFKSHEEVEKIQNRVRDQIHRYVKLVESYGYHAEGITLYYAKIS